MTGTCHCGQVRVTLATKPDYLNACNCSFCAKSGSVWGYFAGGDVAVEGETQRYMRADRERPAAILHFCPTCGSTTHFTLAEHVGHDMTGVNARRFAPEAMAGVELRYPDGRGWDGKTQDFGYLEAHKPFVGEGAYL